MPATPRSWCCVGEAFPRAGKLRTLEKKNSKTEEGIAVGGQPRDTRRPRSVAGTENGKLKGKRRNQGIHIGSRQAWPPTIQRV